MFDAHTVGIFKGQLTWKIDNLGEGPLALRIDYHTYIACIVMEV